MKNLKVTMLAFLMCISMVVPLFTVEATEADGNTDTKVETVADSDSEKESEENEDLEEVLGIPDENTGSEDKQGGDTVAEEESDENIGAGEKSDENTKPGEIVVEIAGQPGEAPIPAMLGAGSDPSGEPEGGANGSGSYQLNENPTDYRFYTEYYVDKASGKSTSTAGIERKTVIKVYAKEGEVILFGSSVSNSEIDENDKWTKGVTGKDIVITTPSGKKICENVLAPGEKNDEGVVQSNGRGYIKNPTQEKNGPIVNHTEQAEATGEYYTPLRYDTNEADGGSGVYTFEFHSQKGYNDGKSIPTPKLAGDPNWEQSSTAVAAWDVTVLGKKTVEGVETDNWEVKKGRAWADYLALTTGDAGTKVSDLDVYVLSHDGYIYNTNFEKAIPYGFIFFANNTGFMTTVSDSAGNKTYTPIYHSFYDSTNDLDHMVDGENIYLHKPNEADTPTEETYKIFFNSPNSDLNGIDFDGDGKVDIKTTPSETVTLSNLKFAGIDDNLSRTGQGGHFSFDASDEAMVTIRLDLRKAILESEQTMDTYSGSGIVEITAPVHEGENIFYWDGKDTDGIVIPAGIYGNQNVVLSTEIKRGELHFPVIDMEGLNGGLRVERKNGTGSELESRFNLYYNNNPLAFGTIEGRDYTRNTAAGYDVLTDGTKSFKIAEDKGGPKFFPDNLNKITTLKKDDKDYLAQKMFNTSYSSLSDDRKSIIDAEFGSEEDTFHFEPVDSSQISMQFTCSGYNGGGNQAGIDAWTYYTQGVEPHIISFAIMDTQDRGLVRGKIFYDVNVDSKYELKTETSGVDYPLSNIKVRLIDADGKPLVHEELLPCFDETGHFIYNKDGSIQHELKKVNYETVTDASGTYRFTGVPYSTEKDTTYYVQVMLTDVQSEVLRYTCTTSDYVKDNYKTSSATPEYFLEKARATGGIDADCGADGNQSEAVGHDSGKVYGHKYSRDTETNETIFDKDTANNIQSVTFSKDPTGASKEGVVRVEEFKAIGYSSTVPTGNQKDYKVTKNWGLDSLGNETHKISDGIIVELWVWNDAAVKEENPLKLSRRTGALMDTQVLNDANEWTYTWKNLDDRLQYYILEYYTKKKPNGEIIYNDKHEPRQVLIGGTMPIFSVVPTGNKGIYGFETDLGDYPEQIVDPNDSTKLRIPIQKFDENKSKVHTNSITKQEKLESVDNNARQYDVTYTLSTVGNTNVIDITNSQVYDDRTYYVWLNHERELPEFVGHTYVDGGTKQSHALELEKDGDTPIIDGEYRIKGISVSSVDAIAGNSEGNATDAFRIKSKGTSVWFTANSERNYITGTGTRTYQVKYVVDATEKKPVSVKVNAAKKLVTVKDGVELEVEATENKDKYIVYSWFMTIHVYDVVSDGVFEYIPNGGAIKLQTALPVGGELKWTLTQDKDDPNKITYTSDDPRGEVGILQNDIFRLPLYKGAVHPDMGTCADLVGIAYAGSTPVDDAAVSKLIFSDTYESRYGTNASSSGNADGTAIAKGSGGQVEVSLNTTRITRINRTQDHANYADVIFKPGKQYSGREDVFYYKIVVFAEDNTYQYNKYDEIDASSGVEMYTYFIMKPKWVAPPNGHGSGSGDNPVYVTSNSPIVVLQPSGVPVPDPGIKVGGNSPKTGDDSHVMLWVCITILGATCVAAGLYRRKKH